MRYFSLLLLLSFFSFTLPACAQKAPPQKIKTKKVGKKAAAAPASPKPVTEASPVLTFERTPCFGTCPAYSMKVFADGRVAYEGRHAVPMLGKQDLKLPAAAVADMLHQAKESHFDQFQERYSRGITDIPSTIVAIRQPDGKLKTVVVETGAPSEVQQLFAYFGSQFDALAKLNATSDK